MEMISISRSVVRPKGPFKDRVEVKFRLDNGVKYLVQFEEKMKPLVYEWRGLWANINNDHHRNYLIGIADPYREVIEVMAS
jgi:hypothetical protein